MLGFVLLSSLVHVDRFWDDVAFFVVLVAILRAVSRRRGILIAMIFLGGIALVSRIVDFLHPGEPMRIVAQVTAVAFLGSTALAVIRDVLRDEEITDDTIYGSICGYLLVGVTWALVYDLVLTISPGALAIPTEISLRNPDSQVSSLMYVSFVTMTTLGYGDITPVAPFDRTLCWIEAFFGQMYLAILVAHLVGMRLAHRTRNLSR